MRDSSLTSLRGLENLYLRLVVEDKYVGQLSGHWRLIFGLWS